MHTGFSVTKTSIWALALVFAGTFVQPTNANDHITIRNRLQVPVTLWFWPEEGDSWLKPPLCIRPRGTADFTIVGNGRYKIVAKTPLRNSREASLGWIDMRLLKQRSDAAELVIDRTIVSESREVTYTVTRPVWETRTQERTIYRKRFTNGRWTYVPETISEDVKVAKMVPEQRTKTIVSKTAILSGSFEEDNSPLMSVVTFRTSNPGAWVRYQLISRRNVNTSQNATNSDQLMAVGIYKIWTERDGVVTSARRYFDIYEESPEITIEEISNE